MENRGITTENTVKMIKIAITGPESTGKSTISSLLARYFNTNWAKEYAREYLASRNIPYGYEDLEIIAKGQLINESDAAKKANRILFCDTELINIKIWSQYKYNKCSQFVLDSIKENTYDFYFLCDIDIPWVKDPLRENPDKREFFLDWFKKELKEYNFPHLLLSGNVFKRMETAITIINKTFK